MAYQSVGTPKFYIDYFSYWQTKGLIHKIDSDEEGGTYHTGHFIGLNPSSPSRIIALGNHREGWSYFSADLTWGNLLSQAELELINFCGVLGHDINKAPTESSFTQQGEYTHSSIRFSAVKRAGENVPTIAQDTRGVFFMGDNIINSELNATGSDKPTVIRESGFSLWNCSIDHQHNGLGDVDRFLIGLKFYEDAVDSDTMYDYSGWWNVNSLVLGHTYKMPHSPDLKVTMSIDYDGFDSTDTTGGSTITNVRYTGAPKWNDLNAWQIGNSESLAERGGRRNWSLKFSYLAGKDLFSSNYMANRYANLEDTENNLDTYTTNDDAGIVYQEESEHFGEEGFTYTLADDDSFIARVLNYVGNGTRFIFQPDSNMSNPSDFAICVVDQDSIKITQVANKVYDISLKIREVW